MMQLLSVLLRTGPLAQPSTDIVAGATEDSFALLPADEDDGVPRESAGLDRLIIDPAAIADPPPVLPQTEPPVISAFALPNTLAAVPTPDLASLPVPVALFRERMEASGKAESATVPRLELASLPGREALSVAVRSEHMEASGKEEPALPDTLASVPTPELASYPVTREPPPVALRMRTVSDKEGIASLRPPAQLAGRGEPGGLVLPDVSSSGWNAPTWRNEMLSQSAGVLLAVPRGGQATPSALAEFSGRLGDVVQSQVQQLAETTRIRLDPPSLGTLDVFIRYQAGHLTVSLSPSHAEVFQQLQASMAQLREQLVSRDYPQVQIRLEEPSTGAWQGGQQGQREQPRDQAAPGRSLGGAGEQSFAAALDDDVPRGLA